MSLSEDIAAARKCGMTYGKYMAYVKKDHTVPVKKKKEEPLKPLDGWREQTCPCCGKVFFTNHKAKKFCGQPCYYRYNNVKRCERKRQEKHNGKKK